MIRALSIVLATISSTVIFLAATQAQEIPDNSDLCTADPVRVVHMALFDEEYSNISGSRFTIAVASAASAYDYDAGVSLRIHQVLDEPFPEDAVKDGLIHADVRTAFRCFPHGAWADDSPKFARFMIHEEGIFTAHFWPLIDDDSNQLAPDAFTDGVDTAEQLVDLPGGPMTIDELFAAARAYVDPTPTPFPEGIPTPDLTPPDTAGGVTLPSTGRSDGDGADVLIVTAAAVALALAAAGVVWRVTAAAGRSR